MTAVLLIAAALFINLYGCAAIMEDGDYHSKVRKHPRIMHFFGKSFIGIIALVLAYMAGRGGL